MPRAAVFCGLFSTIAAMGFGVYLVINGKAEAGAVIALGQLDEFTANPDSQTSSKLERNLLAMEAFYI